MKYFIYHNLEMDYDDVETDEVLLFSAPENFEFSHELSKRYQEEVLGMECRLVNEYPFVEIRNKGYWYDGNIRRIMERDENHRNQLVEWLKQFGIEKLEYAEWQ
jgi:hypothetical protein